MGMLDVLKRWFGGGSKAASARPTPQVRTSSPVAPATAAPSAVAQSAPLSINDALDAIAKAGPKPAPAKVDRREKPRVNAREGTRVLVIDDSPTIVALLKRMLEQSGYIALEASDAETGVSMALSEVPDLIFLDIVLPGMNGFEALRRLRRDPISKIIPIVMISGNELATEQFYAQRIGADDFMKKPFSRSEVFARIEKLLDADKVPRRHLAVVAAAPVAPAAVIEAPAVALPLAAAASIAEVPVAVNSAHVVAVAQADAPASLVSASVVIAAAGAAQGADVAAPPDAAPAAVVSVELPGVVEALLVAVPVVATTTIAPAEALAQAEATIVADEATTHTASTAEVPDVSVPPDPHARAAAVVASSPVAEIPVAEVLVAAVPVGGSPIVMPFTDPAAAATPSASYVKAEAATAPPSTSATAPIAAKADVASNDVPSAAAGQQDVQADILATGEPIPQSNDAPATKTTTDPESSPDRAAIPDSTVAPMAAETTLSPAVEPSVVATVQAVIASSPATTSIQATTPTAAVASAVTSPASESVQQAAST